MSVYMDLILIGLLQVLDIVLCSNATEGETVSAQIFSSSVRVKIQKKFT